MKNNIVTLCIAAAVALSTNSVFAGTAGTKYVGVGYGIATYSEDAISEEFNPTALVGVLGANVTDNFSIEGRLGIGMQDDTVNVAGIADFKLGLDSLIGVYGVGHINLNESSSVYGLLGISRIEGTISIPDFPEFGSSSDDDTGLSYGIGVDIGVGKNVALNIEYVQYLNKSDFDISAIGFGVKFGF